MSNTEPIYVYDKSSGIWKIESAFDWMTYAQKLANQEWVKKYQYAYPSCFDLTKTFTTDVRPLQPGDYIPFGDYGLLVTQINPGKVIYIRQGVVERWEWDNLEGFFEGLVCER